MIITIDGPSGSGKSTVAKTLARSLDFIYFDTGALYRSLSYYLLKEKIDIENPEALLEGLRHFLFEIKKVEEERRYFVGGEDVTEAIRSKAVTQMASKVSAYPEVRTLLKPLQMLAAEENNVIFEGRDMGTALFPHAEIKFFLTATAKVRAQRRLRELQEKFPNQSFTYKEVLRDIKERDHRDSTRACAPLKRAKDAALIDTSSLTVEEIVKSMQRQTALLLKKKNRPSFAYRFCISATRFLFKLLYRHKVYGLSHFPKGSALIAPNHTSFLDPPCVAISCPKEIHFLARRSLFKSYFGRLITALNSHPVDPGGSNLQLIKEVCTLLKGGKRVLLFPEGTRSLDGSLQPIQRGVGLLLGKSGAPLLPTYVHGTYAIWNRRRKWPKMRGKTAVVFGSPIYWESYAHKERKEAQKALTADLERALKSLRLWYEAGAYGTPP